MVSFTLNGGWYLYAWYLFDNGQAMVDIAVEEIPGCFQGTITTHIKYTGENDAFQNAPTEMASCTGHIYAVDYE